MPRLRPALWTLLLAACLVSGSSFAADWSPTFSKEAVGSYLDTPQKLIVVGAGQGSKEAAGALETALRDSGKAPLVMNDQALGPVADLDDQAIVKKASSMPIDRIFIVRVFPGGSGQPDNAVITLYDKAGAVTAAFTAQNGTALAARGGLTPGVGQGVSSAAASTVSKVIQDAGSSPNSQDEYDKKYLAIEEVSLYNQYGTPIKVITKFYQGKYKNPINGDELFRLLERPDLGAQFQTRTQTRMGLIAGGVILSGVGYALMFLPLLNHDSNSVNDNTTSFLIGGGVVVLGGTGMILGGAKMNPMPLSASETAQLMDEYNKGLKKKLGLSSAASSSSPGSRIALRLFPQVGRTGGGLSLSLSF